MMLLKISIKVLEINKYFLIVNRIILKFIIKLYYNISNIEVD